MVVKHISRSLAKRIHKFAFVMLLLPIIALIGWLSMAMLASGTPRPRVLTIRLDILLSMIASALLYFK